MTPPPLPTTAPHHNLAEERHQKKRKTQVAVAWTSSAPRIPPKPPHRVQRQMQVEAGMCRKSRDGKNTAKTDAKCDTHRKTPKKRMRRGQLSTMLDSAARRLLHFFARKHRKRRCEKKTQVQFRASKVPRFEFQHMPAKKSTHPARRQTHVLPTTCYY